MQNKGLVHGRENEVNASVPSRSAVRGPRFLGKRGSVGAHLLQDGASVKTMVEEIGLGK